MLCDGEIFEHEGFRFKVSFEYDFEYDQDFGPPWENCDGHGVVSEWTTRDKRPGERVLSSDRGSKRYYDVAESIKIAKRDGWDAPPYGGKSGERAARAVEADFQYLRGWCNDEWHYVVIGVVQVDDEGDEVGETEYLRGVEDIDEAYLEAEARNLAMEIVGRLRHEQHLEKVKNRFRDAMECGL